jgi:cobyrinic acid a,c-diamide synthase
MSGRLLLAGTHSSVGKTTVTLALLAALRGRGVRVAPFKAGPDYIDPGLHALAAGAPSRNLDQWLLGDSTLRTLLVRGVREADLAVIEGVMGLYDGIGAGQTGSTAAVARALACPVVLVLDVSAMSGTAAALVLGCQRMQPGVDLRGVILNRVGSDGHRDATAEAILAATGLPVLGSLPEDPRVAIPERHLGLVPAHAGGLPSDLLERLAQLARERFDLDALRRLAELAPPLTAESTTVGAPPQAHARIAVAQDAAFGFYYQDTLDVLADAGAELVPFSPLADQRLPEGTQGVYLGGGFPELFARDIAANEPIRAAVRLYVRDGHPVYAECGGLMALGQTLTTFEGDVQPMWGILPFASRMQRDSLTIGYREVEAVQSSPLMPVGTRVRGHEFHWSTGDPPAAECAAYRVLSDDRREGFVVGATVGSYVHLNLVAYPQLAAHFVQACAAVVD